MSWQVYVNGQLYVWRTRSCVSTDLLGDQCREAVKEHGFDADIRCVPIPHEDGIKA